MMKKMVFALAALLITAGLTACGTQDKQEDTGSTEAQVQQGSTTIAASAEEKEGFTSFTAVNLDGDEVTEDIFADYDLTMVNIWGTFCQPCISEMPDLGEIHAEYQDKKFQVVGIVIDVFDRNGEISEEQLALGREIVEATGAAYTHLVPSAELVQSKLKDVTGIPETVFVDKDGNFVGQSYLGARDKEQWVKIIDSMLTELQ